MRISSISPFPSLSLLLLPSLSSPSFSLFLYLSLSSSPPPPPRRYPLLYHRLSRIAEMGGIEGQQQVRRERRRGIHILCVLVCVCVCVCVFAYVLVCMCAVCCVVVCCVLCTIANANVLLSPFSSSVNTSTGRWAWGNGTTSV